LIFYHIHGTLDFGNLQRPFLGKIMADNLLKLDLSRFTRSDVSKIHRLQGKLRLMHRWFRCERIDPENPGNQGEIDTFAIYSGDRGPKQYVCYHINRLADGAYELRRPPSETPIARGRALDSVIAALPDDFFYTPR